MHTKLCQILSHLAKWKTLSGLQLKLHKMFAIIHVTNRRKDHQAAREVKKKKNAKKRKERKKKKMIRQK